MIDFVTLSQRLPTIAVKPAMVAPEHEPARAIALRLYAGAGKSDHAISVILGTHCHPPMASIAAPSGVEVARSLMQLSSCQARSSETSSASNRLKRSM
jgi:hypothetical protein